MEQVLFLLDVDEVMAGAQQAKSWSPARGRWLLSKARPLGASSYERDVPSSCMSSGMPDARAKEAQGRARVGSTFGLPGAASPLGIGVGTLTVGIVPDEPFSSPSSSWIVSTMNGDFAELEEVPDAERPLAVAEPDAVEAGAVGAAQVADAPAAVGGTHLGVVAADRVVVENDLQGIEPADAQQFRRLPGAGP